MLTNPEHTTERITGWIKKFFDENGKKSYAIVGISGGKDSATVAALCVKALGKERVIGILLPNGEQKDIDDARKTVKLLDIKNITLNIKKVNESMREMLEESEEMKKISGRNELTEDAKINIIPRLRMTALYAVAQMFPEGGRVANTCNLSEDYVGYSTKFGDSAGDFAPIAGLLVEEVKQIGKCLELPDEIIEKTPSDGLSGLSDEEKIGFTYKTLDKYILTGICENDETKKRIDGMHKVNLHKLKKIPAYEPDSLDRKLTVK